MSRFLCRCGFEIRNIQCPTRHEAWLVTDTELDNLPTGGAGVSTYDVMTSRSVLECPECFRIWIRLKPGTGPYLPYSPDETPLKLADQQGGYRG
jgi:hypothetical protein